MGRASRVGGTEGLPWEVLFQVLWKHTVALISQATRMMLEILQASTVGEPRTPSVQTGFRKGRGARGQTASLRWIIEKAKGFQKNIYFMDYAEAFDCVDHNILENSERDGNTRPP